MIKKFISALSLGLLISTAASAQFFSMTPANDTIIHNTTGQGNYNSSQGTFSNTIDLNFYINNTSDSSLIIKWQLMSDSTEHPLGWVLTGICDNSVCRTPWSDFYYGIEQTAQVIASGETDPVKTLMEARIYAPVGSADGIGVFRVRLRAYYPSDVTFATPLQTKNITYIVRKNVTSVASIQADDKRVSLYPNPATSNLRIVTEKSLNAQRISILNINGAQAMSIAVAKDTENTNVNINTLASGTYMVRVNDANGNMITTRKFVKK